MSSSWIGPWKSTGSEVCTYKKANNWTIRFHRYFLYVGFSLKLRMIICYISRHKSAHWKLLYREIRNEIFSIFLTCQYIVTSVYEWSWRNIPIGYELGTVTCPISIPHICYRSARSNTISANWGITISNTRFPGKIPISPITGFIQESCGSLDDIWIISVFCSIIFFFRKTSIILTRKSIP